MSAGGVSKLDSSPGFDSFSGHLLLRILDKVQDKFDKQAWRLACKQFYVLDIGCWKRIRLVKVEMIQQVLQKYTHIEDLDLSSCTKVTDENLVCVAEVAGKRLLSITILRMGSFTLAGITALTRGCSSLQNVDLSYCSNVGDLEISAVSQLSNLRRLTLTGCYMISDAGLECLASGCKKLDVLVLKGCVGISDAGIGVIASNCKDLSTLDISYTEITDEALKSLANLRLLKILNLATCSNVGDEGLARTSTSLVTLDLCHCKNVTAIGVAALAKRGLQHLNLGYCSPITGELLQAVGKFNSIQTLKLDGCEVAGEGLRLVGSGCRQLRELSLSKCRGATDTGIASIISGCRNLHKLDLTSCRDVSEATIYSIIRLCGGLTSLKMEACHMLTEYNIMLLGEHCRCLEELDLTDCSVSDIGLQSVARCTALKSLRLGFCDITDGGIRHVGRSCCNLTELDLYRSANVGDNGVAAIASGCARLRVLNLSYCLNLSDASIIPTFQLKELHQLEIRGCKMVTLVDVEHLLPECRSLIELDLKHCSHIGDAGMSTIVKCFPNLQQLNISYCPITNTGLMSITKLSCMQNIKLIHLKNVSIECLGLTLLRSECLKKVKLLSQLMPTMSTSVIQELEERGCRLRWMQKSYDY